MARPIPAVILLACIALGAPPTGEAFAELSCPNTELFGAPVAVVTGRNPLYTVAADFDKDGDLDLAVTNSDFLGGGALSSVAVMLNNGQGAFPTVTTIAVPNNARGITCGDFNEDGIFDLAVACYGANKIAVLRGLGSGGLGNGFFALPVEFVAPGGPFEIVTGDFDHDGILDLAAAQNSAAGVVVLRGLGTGGIGNGAFGAPLVATLANLSTGIVLGDFTGDGTLDLVATENFSATVGLLRGLGTSATANAGFAPVVHFPAGVEPQTMALCDYNEDGIQDLIVANGTSGGTAILRGGGGGGIADGTFTRIGTLPSGNTSSVATLDANDDGITDIVSGESTGPIGRRLHLFLGLGAGGAGDGTYVPGAVIGMPALPYRMTVAALDDESYPDLVVSEYQSDRVELLRGGCNGPLPDARAPFLAGVRDVPADEGGRVYLTWLRSSLDATGGAVQSYRVWRRIPEELAKLPGLAATEGRERMERTETGPNGETLVTFWENLATLPAERLEGYGYAAATTEDSTAERPVRTSFYVTAATANIDVFYPSNVDSGASIDNLAPESPANLHAASASPAGRRLVWAANSEPDLDAYRLERSGSPAFAPGEIVVLSTQADTEYVDTDVAGEASYRVVALDRSRNASAPSAVLTFGAVGVADVPRLALAGTHPHPARGGSLRIAFSLATDAPARLEVFDAAGRRVAAPALAGMGAGPHVVSLAAGRALTPGVYWARLVQGEARVERRIVVID